MTSSSAVHSETLTVRTIARVNVLIGYLPTLSRAEH